MSAKPDYVVSKLTRPTGAAATGGFVINLTSSTTPMALSQPKDPTLAQYTFFVSRRLEDGRERFRLHMGYFETLQSAEEMLNIVREVYPQAWAGEAPGKKLRANSEAAAQAAAKPAAPVARAAAPAPVAAPAAPVANVTVTTAPAPAPAVAAPVVEAPIAQAPLAIVESPPPAATVAAPQPAAPQHHPFASTPPPAPKVEFDEPFLLADGDTDFRTLDVPVIHPPAPVEAKTVASPHVARPASAPARPAAAKPAAPAKAAATKPATKPVAPAAKPAAPVAKAAPAKPAAKPPVAAKPAAPVAPAKPPVAAPKIAAQVSAPALQAASPAATASAVKAPEPTVQMPALRQPPLMSATPSLSNVRQVLEELDDLSDTQTIRLLERHTPFREGSSEASVDEAIRVIKPEDAQSMAAIKSDVKRNAPVLFAVQLDWSVTPFDMGKVPPLAIFNAYTLYTTEANREGRTWYGLRMGFFSDAVSAKQVAYYVRSDFKTVSVVPVTTLEKERATDLNADRSGIHRAANVKEGPSPTPQSLTASTSGMFKLLEDDMPAHIEQDVDGEMSPRFSKPAAPAAPAAPSPKAAAHATRARKPPAKAGKRDAHTQVNEETLDQTLEILGANTLEMSNDSETGVRHLRVKVDKKGSKFASLIDRLSGKK
jgi:hypothetical protein